MRRVNGDIGDPLLVASTVFNSRGQPSAEDQWRSAGAVLRYVEEQRCSVVLVPPLGTGTFDWPVRQALVNWLYGAIIWCRSNPTVTARSVWPVLCVPGSGDQKLMGHYLSELSRERLEFMRDRKLTIRVRYEGATSNELHVRHDVLLGSFGRTAFQVSSLFGSAIGTGQDLSRGALVLHSITMAILPSLGQYSLTATSLRHMFPFESDGPLTTALSRRRGTLGAAVR